MSYERTGIVNQEDPQVQQTKTNLYFVTIFDQGTVFVILSGLLYQTYAENLSIDFVIHCILCNKCAFKSLSLPIIKKTFVSKSTNSIPTVVWARQKSLPRNYNYLSKSFYYYRMFVELKIFFSYFNNLEFICYRGCTQLIYLQSVSITKNLI